MRVAMLNNNASFCNKIGWNTWKLSNKEQEENEVKNFPFMQGSISGDARVIEYAAAWSRSH